MEATRRLCMMFDIYFDEKLFNSALNTSDAKNSLILSYVKKTNLHQYKNRTFDNTLEAERKAAAVVIESPEEAEAIEDVNPNTVKLFGSGFQPKDYLFLQTQFDDWTAKHECKDKATEELFKRLCFNQLETLKATREGKNTKDLDKSFQEMMAAANLQPRQNATNVMAESNTMGTLLEKYEHERPLPEIDESLRDVDKIGLYIDVFFKGHLAKMLDIKNGLSNLYDKFMRKYTVEKPEYKEGESSDAIFDAIFGSKSLDD